MRFQRGIGDSLMRRGRQDDVLLGFLRFRMIYGFDLVCLAVRIRSNWSRVESSNTRKYLTFPTVLWSFT